jgi:hypothetical protein
VRVHVGVKAGRGKLHRRRLVRIAYPKHFMPVRYKEPFLGVCTVSLNALLINKTEKIKVIRYRYRYWLFVKKMFKFYIYYIDSVPVNSMSA